VNGVHGRGGAHGGGGVFEGHGMAASGSFSRGVLRRSLCRTQCGECGVKGVHGGFTHGGGGSQKGIAEMHSALHATC
jgi:hypothetical protein